MIAATVVLSLFIALFIGMLTFFWGFLVVGCTTVMFFVVPVMIICFVIYLTKYGKRFARFINLRNTIIICGIIAAIIIVPAIYFNYTSGFPSEIINVWHCDEGQALCTNESCSELRINFDYEYGSKTGIFFEANLTGEREFEFRWSYDGFSKEFTMQKKGSWASWNNDTKEWGWITWDWELKLRLDVTSSQKMTTHYISDKNAPFNAKLFDGVTWTAS